jgi:hypothetical protein
MRLPIRAPLLSETRPKTMTTRQKQLFSALFCKVCFLRTTRYVMVGTFVSYFQVFFNPSFSFWKYENRFDEI